METSTHNLSVSFHHSDSYMALSTSAEHCELCKLLKYALDIGDVGGGIEKRKHFFKEIMGDGNDSRSHVYLLAGNIYWLGYDTPKKLTFVAVTCGTTFTNNLNLYTNEGESSLIKEYVLSF
jgi:hypothetical protein